MASDVRDALGRAGETAVCPSCDASALTIFHEQRGVPVHSCQLVATAEAAKAFPRGDLVLGLCRVCGFITNTAYDSAPQDYSHDYEETQGFSGRFRAFANDLASRWVAKYELAGKDVLEIGCGKGEFLVSMLGHGVRHGIGIDPSIVEDRIPPELAGRLTLVKDYYAASHTHFPADAIVCRHTLEHISDVGGFVQLLRSSIGARDDVVVLFEVPDALRVLREPAFWDIYYEHCSYFSPGALARLFRAAGFDVLDLALDYDDQYVLLGCRPARRPSSVSAMALEEDPAEVEDAVERFCTQLAECRAAWLDRLRAVRAGGRAAVVWGAGSKGVSLLTTLGVADEVACAVDVNPYKHGKFIAGTGHEIVAPDALIELQPALVVLMNPIYQAEVASELRALGVKAEVLPVFPVPDD